MLYSQMIVGVHGRGAKDPEEGGGERQHHTIMKCSHILLSQAWLSMNPCKSLLLQDAKNGRAVCCGTEAGAVGGRGEI